MPDQPTPCHITERDEVLGELFREVGLEYEGPRYVTVQIDYPTWTEMREAANRVALHAARAPNPSVPDVLQERLDRLYIGALSKHESCSCPIGLSIRADYFAIKGVLRREGLVP